MKAARNYIISVTLAATFSLAAFAGERPKSDCRNVLKVTDTVTMPYTVSDVGRIEVNVNTANPRLNKFLKIAARLFFGATGLDKIETVMQRFMVDKRDLPFWVRFSEAYGQKIEFDEELLALIPKTGALVIVANHPINGAEGVALAALISRVRPDVKVVLTPLVAPVPGMNANAIYVNPYGGRRASLANLTARQEMQDHVASGGVLIIFPSGEVSSKKNLSDPIPYDREWRAGVAKMLSFIPGAQVLPIFVDEQASRGYYLAEKLHENIPEYFALVRASLKMVMHARMLGKSVDRVVKLVIGPVLSADKLLSLGDSQMMPTLREITYGLSDGSGAALAAPYR